MLLSCLLGRPEDGGWFVGIVVDDSIVWRKVRLSVGCSFGMLENGGVCETIVEWIQGCKIGELLLRCWRGRLRLTGSGILYS